MTDPNSRQSGPESAETTTGAGAQGRQTKGAWQRGLRLPLWQRVLLVSALVLAGIAAAVVTTALLVVALPLLLLAGFLIQRALVRRTPGRSHPGSSGGPGASSRVIEGEYRVVDEETEDHRRGTPR